MKATQLYYDLQKNQYQLIDKVTGTINKSNKSGSLPKKFNTQITGIDYRLRKNKNNNNHFSQPISINKLYSNSVSIPKITHNKIQEDESLLVKRKLQSPLKMFTNRKADRYLKSTESNLKDCDSVLNPSRFHQKDTTLGILEKYATIETQKIQENHSLYKSIEGNSPTSNVPSLRITSDKFQISLKKDTSMRQKALKAQGKESPLGFFQGHKQFQSKLTNQKKVFLKFHPQHEFRQNEKSIYQQKERKKNFKILENLFIHNNNYHTKDVYNRQ